MIELIKAFFKTGLGAICSLALGAITIKIIALILDPQGVGIFSLLKQVQQFGIAIATLGGQVALVQGLASLKAKDRDAYLVWSAGFFTIGSIVISIVFLLLSPQLSRWIFNSTDPKMVGLIRVMPVLIISGSFYTYFTSVLNGNHAIGKLAWTQILLAMTTTITIYPTLHWVQKGHFSALVLPLGLAFTVGSVFSFFISRKNGWLEAFGKINYQEYFFKVIKHFFSLGGVNLLAMMISAITLISLRSVIIHHQGLSSAGIYEAAWMISMTYVTLLLSSFGTYYLPKLSGIVDSTEKQTLIAKLFRLTTLLLIPLVIMMICSKPLIIQILYSDKFSPSLKIIRWMLIGDYIKVSSWVIAMPMVAYADVKNFIILEILWNLGFLLIAAISMVYFNSLQGIGIAFLIQYSLNACYIFYYSQKRGYFILKNENLKLWLIGLALVILSSWKNWGETKINWVSLLFFFSLAILLIYFNLTKSEKTQILNFIK